MKYFLALALFLTPGLAAAQSFGTTPTRITVSEGETFSIVLKALPNSTSIYTASAHLSFDPTLLAVTQFVIAPSWIPLTQPGYDLTDNKNGVLIKTGGHPGGIKADTPFGTITFKALKSGTATISITKDSVLLDEESKNRLSGTQGSTSVAIGEREETLAPETSHLAPAPSPRSAVAHSEKEPVATDTPAAASSSLASVAFFDTLSWNTLALIGAILFFLASLWVRFGKHRE